MKIENYSMYEIYPNEGKVWSYRTNEYIGCKKENGYYQTILTDDKGKKKLWRLNRLIWTAVNGIIPKGMEVNHINEDKENNSISNLNLLSHQDNNNWGAVNKRRSKKLSKAVAALKNGEIVAIYNSTIEATKDGYHSGSISNCCLGKRKTHRGLQWKYIVDFVDDKFVC